MMKQVKKVKCKVLQKLPGSSLPLEVSKVKAVKKVLYIGCFYIVMIFEVEPVEINMSNFWMVFSVEN